jgi:hypothetical protein
MKDKDFNQLENHLKKFKSKYILPAQIETYQIKENQLLLNYIDTFIGILLKFVLRIKRNRII